MKITKHNTKWGNPIVLLGLILWGLYFFILLEPVQARWVPIVAKTGNYPSFIFTSIIALIVGALVGVVVFIGYLISARHNTMDEKDFFEFDFKRLLDSPAFLTTVILFTVATLALTIWWRTEL